MKRSSMKTFVCSLLLLGGILFCDRAHAVPVTYLLSGSGEIGSCLFTFDFGPEPGDYSARKVVGHGRSSWQTWSGPWLEVKFEASVGSNPALVFRDWAGVIAYPRDAIGGEEVLPDSSPAQELEHIAETWPAEWGTITRVAVPDQGPSLAGCAALLAVVICVANRSRSL